MAQTAVIIVAGGGGSRMGSRHPKQFMFLGNEPILARTINNFAQALPEAEIVVVLPSEYLDYWKNLTARFEVARHVTTEGGGERFHSVRNGLAALTGDAELIAIQDGVRPLGTQELILRMVAAAAEHGAAIPVIEPVDSFREADGNSSRIIDRHKLRIVQTPQVFRAEWLREAYNTTFNPTFTDDASVVEQAGYPLFLGSGEFSNLKITTPEDLLYATAIIESRDTAAAENNNTNNGEYL